MKGKGGAENLNDSGARSIKEAEASINSLSRSEKMLNVFKVIKFDNVGNGASFPGVGSPESAGTIFAQSRVDSHKKKRTYSLDESKI
jgi:hypothetical protein